MHAHARQLTFDDRRRHGGRRTRAGRPRKGEHTAIPHRARAPFKRWNPVHVTLRARALLPSFRGQTVCSAFFASLRASQREDFRIVAFSVQRDHVHLVVEADSAEALTRGMRAVTIRLALRFNRAIGRARGKVWRERYHRRDLTSPRQVRRTLVYVLANYKKHFGVTDPRPRIDPCSSAPWFDGWTAARAPPPEPRPTSQPRTALLAYLWKRHGLVHPGERPAMRAP